MLHLEILQTANALLGLSILMVVSYQLKRSLKTYARTGSFR